jgi:hypothetical protein
LKAKDQYIHEVKMRKKPPLEVLLLLKRKNLLGLSEIQP